jgi:SAM-dependent methyltransferase
MSEATDQIKSQIKERFVRVALEPQAKQRHPTGPESAERLGYDAAEIEALPTQVTESFAGVGNPLALGELNVGETLLDLGSGAGLDSIIAARQVGPTGKVIGVDMTEQMVEKAKANAVVAGVQNAEFYHGEIDRLPVSDESVDLVISNGVFNLCFDKPKVLGEVFRVLRPGGRIQMADILLDDGVTPQQVEQKGAWSD